MNGTYDLYQPGGSWLHRLDPRAKLLLVTCIILVLLTYGNLWVMVLVLLGIHLTLRAAGIDTQRIRWVWKITLPTMILIAVLWPLLYPAGQEAFLSIWFVRLSLRNIAQALAIAIRIGAVGFVIFVWLFTTDQTAQVRGLVSLGLPFDWGLVIAMALRFLPTMAVTFRTIMEAQQARGLDLGKGNLLQRIRNYAPILVSMIITALRTADHVSRALESRALGASPRRTSLHALHFGRPDLVFTLCIVTVTAALMIARYALGFCADVLSLLP